MATAATAARAALTVFILCAAATRAAGQTSEERVQWNQPVEPFRIVGNVHYVGAAGVSAFLIRTSDGLILLDGGLPETAPRIAESIAKLGLNLRDVRYLLNSHAHFDHGGGLARLKRLSGAAVVASGPDAVTLKAGGKDMPAVAVDRVIRDRETVTLGDTVLTARVTAGHTKGCTTWTMKTIEAGREVDVLFHCSTSVVDTLIGNRTYPNIVSDYQRTFTVLRNLEADVFLAPHPFFFGMVEKRKKVRPGAANPFIDPTELGRFNDRAEQQFAARLEKERAALRFVDDPEAYSVYTSLVPRSWPVRVADATTLVFQEETTTGWSGCLPSGRPVETEWRDVFEDFKAANADVSRLRAGRSLILPYQVLSASEISAYFVGDWLSGAWWDRFHANHPDARGYMTVSAVGFNRARTRAMVYFAHQCGSLCGAGRYYLLEKVDGAWREVKVAGVKLCGWVS